MGWTKVAANGGMGLEAQWILKECNAPLCSLKVDEDKIWYASLLHPSGISAARLIIGLATVVEAQAACETELRLMGWSWGREVQA